MTVADTMAQPRFAFSAEQLELRTVVRQALEQCSSSDRVFAAIATDLGYETAAWALVAGQLGLAGLAIPEDLGGAGAGHVELGVVMEECGRALLCGPLFATTALAVPALLHSYDAKQQRVWLPRLASGAATATVALTDGGGDADPPAVPVVARTAEPGGDWRLDGTKLFVIDGAQADLLVVHASVEGVPALFVVDADAPGLRRTPTATLDLTRRQARFDLTDCPATLLVGPDRAAHVLNQVLMTARTLLAAEQIGGAQRCLEMSVQHASVREQFGQPIGAFQAIKHRCAEMFVEVELARSTAHNAAWELEAAGDESSDAGLAVSMAKAACSDAYVFAATENIQVHGGTGFSWEHPAHLYFRRAHSSAVMFGSADVHRELVAGRLGL